MKTPLILLSLLALATPQDPEKLYLKKSNGDIVAGTLVSLQGAQVRMQVQVLGGGPTASRAPTMATALSRNAVAVRDEVPALGPLAPRVAARTTTKPVQEAPCRCAASASGVMRTY